MTREAKDPTRSAAEKLTRSMQREKGVFITPKEARAILSMLQSAETILGAVKR